MPAGSHLVIGGLDVASLATAAVQLSGFAPTFSNSFIMDQLGTKKPNTSQLYSNKMGGVTTVKIPVHVDMHQFIDFRHFDIYDILQCNDSSSSSKYIKKAEQSSTLKIGVLPDIISDVFINTPDDILEEYKRLLYLETSQGVFVYFPDLKRKQTLTDPHIDQSLNPHKKKNEKLVEAKSVRNTNDNGNGKEKKAREEKGKRKGSGRGSLEGSDDDNDPQNGGGDDSSDDVGNWRDNDSEDEESEDEESEEDESGEDEVEDDMDTPNFRNSISARSKKSIPNFHTTSKAKKKSSSERQGTSVVTPVQGSVWKLLAPSSDDVSVGEI